MTAKISGCCLAIANDSFVFWKVAPMFIKVSIPFSFAREIVWSRSDENCGKLRCACESIMFVGFLFI